MQEFKIIGHMTTNKWVKVKAEKPQEIDKLVIDVNEEIDNLIFDLTHSKTAAKGRSLGEIKVIGNIGQLGPTIELTIEDDGGGIILLKDGTVHYRTPEGASNSLL